MGGGKSENLKSGKRKQIMKSKIKMYRQGDVLLERIEEIPAGALKQAKCERIILAHGEMTGHHHSILGRDADWWRAEPAPENAAPAAGQSVVGTLVADQFVTVKRATDLVHQEHGPVALAPGNYRVRRQREYQPEAIRNVAD